MKMKMNNILIEQSENSPKVIMDQEIALIEFEGRSYPENAFAFYRPITEWLKKYFKFYDKNSQRITINFKFLYFNSATTQIIFEILDIIEESGIEGIDIYWFYDKASQNGFEDYEDYSDEFPELNIQAVAY
ncbi:MAG: Unknown protein [uncultured Sulfurovum sp.]|uniref:SiaC family regulatory phosphoprotein domain-containing protein n=1 Tax=uncultured Sulfurovum sp. TaxID=269237 RepID=A0A6S6SXC4_9BACT|nr:MAG: Unknown protein [uncultured Sulfurovum sp.]